MVLKAIKIPQVTSMGKQWHLSPRTFIFAFSVVMEGLCAKHVTMEIATDS